MKKSLAIAAISTSLTDVAAQNTQTYNNRELEQILATDVQDTDRVWARNNLGRNIQNSDTAPLLAEQGALVTALRKLY